MELQQWLGKDNELGQDIWHRKYQSDPQESFDDWIDRVSGGNKDIADLIQQKKFLFGGRILANRGLNKKGRKITYSNCYTTSSPEDNLESIFDCAKKLARTYSYGGGCGVDISKLAPKGAKIHNAAKETSGAISFMDLFSLVTGLIGQNGRRGALMITLSCMHPDIQDFITIKTDLEKVTKANISIRFTDEFMKCAEAGKDITLSFTRPETCETIERTVNAREILHLMAQTNHDYGEPGALFWDKITGYNLVSENKDFELVTTNPCGELPLPAGGSCLLGSINLAEFVIDPFLPSAEFDFEEFDRCVPICVRALNEVLDEGLELHPLKEQRDSVRNWKQIGFGIMGLADCLIKLGMNYGSQAARDLCDNIGYHMASKAIFTSSELSHEKGPYPMYSTEAQFKSEYFKQNTLGDTPIQNHVAMYGMRNSNLLTIAPTGTLSTMLGISGGIEPIYALSYTRKTESLYGEDKYYKVYAQIVKDFMRIHNMNCNEGEEIHDDSELPDYFVTAMTLNYKDRIKMQATWQQHIDASISSTVNVPEDFTVEDIENLYLYAWKQGCKGVTLFRDKCKRASILSTGTDSTEHSDENSLKRGEVIEVSNDLIGKKRKLMTGCGSLHCVAFFDPHTGDLMETYLSKGSTGGCNNFMVGLSRMISLSARGGMSIDDIIDQLQSTGSCPSYVSRRVTNGDTSKGSCCPMAVGNALKDMHEEILQQLSEKQSSSSSQKHVKSHKQFIQNIQNSDSNNTCPECGEPLIFEGGCNICKNCGWSRCM